MAFTLQLAPGGRSGKHAFLEPGFDFVSLLSCWLLPAIRACLLFNDDGFLLLGAAFHLGGRVTQTRVGWRGVERITPVGLTVGFGSELRGITIVLGSGEGDVGLCRHHIVGAGLGRLVRLSVDGVAVFQGLSLLL